MLHTIFFTSTVRHPIELNRKFFHFHSSVWRSNCRYSRKSTSRDRLPLYRNGACGGGLWSCIRVSWCDRWTLIGIRLGISIAGDRKVNREKGNPNWFVFSYIHYMYRRGCIRQSLYRNLAYNYKQQVLWNGSIWYSIAQSIAKRKIIIVLCLGEIRWRSFSTRR